MTFTNITTVAAAINEAADQAFLETSAATLDIPRARKQLEHLRAHPEEHTQMYYGVQKSACRTTGCIAGNIVMSEPDVKLDWQDGILLSADGQSPAERARQLLGLSTSSMADLFFCMRNDVALNRLQGWIDIAERVQHGG